ncbi:hypothetical protein [Burkholderia vietnamiensis]|uniref:hypothetical protein n=1 Tax=Burkholderia vietnamiensis TaxID=60552 RepID=UPI001CF5A97F|nr:hypothetical protein [Burkholderia vietnamiensis]MCA8148172.1 hypothetical protein [Burkholderia vietnamiensis]
MERFTHVTTRNSPTSKTYQQPTYRDHPAGAVPITGEFTLTVDEALYILGVAAQARHHHFDWVKLMDARTVWIGHDPSPVGGFMEHRTKTVYMDAGIMVSADNFHIQGRECNDGPLLKTMHIRMDDLARDFALVLRDPDAKRKAA